MAIMLVYEHIICSVIRSRLFAQQRSCPLFLFSPCPKLLGANEKLCICELCGRSLLVPGSPTIICIVYDNLLDCGDGLRVVAHASMPKILLQDVLGKSSEFDFGVLFFPDKLRRGPARHDDSGYLPLTLRVRQGSDEHSSRLFQIPWRVSARPRVPGLIENKTIEAGLYETK